MQYDFKKEWEKTKEKLNKFSKEAAEVAKKGEAELIRLSHQSKLHIDSTAIGLKKEHLLYQLGKEYFRVYKNGGQSAQLTKLIQDLESLEKEQRDLTKKINSEKRSKKRK